MAKDIFCVISFYIFTNIILWSSLDQQCEFVATAYKVRDLCPRLYTETPTGVESVGTVAPSLNTDSGTERNFVSKLKFKGLFRELKRIYDNVNFYVFNTRTNLLVDVTRRIKKAPTSRDRRNRFCANQTTTDGKDEVAGVDRIKREANRETSTNNDWVIIDDSTTEDTYDINIRRKKRNIDMSKFDLPPLKPLKKIELDGNPADKDNSTAQIDALSKQVNSSISDVDKRLGILTQNLEEEKSEFKNLAQQTVEEKTTNLYREFDEKFAKMSNDMEQLRLNFNNQSNLAHTQLAHYIDALGEQLDSVNKSMNGEIERLNGYHKEQSPIVKGIGMITLTLRTMRQFIGYVMRPDILIKPFGLVVSEILLENAELSEAMTLSLKGLLSEFNEMNVILIKLQMLLSGGMNPDTIIQQGQSSGQQLVEHITQVPEEMSHVQEQLAKQLPVKLDEQIPALKSVQLPFVGRRKRSIELMKEQQQTDTSSGSKKSGQIKYNFAMYNRFANAIEVEGRAYGKMCGTNNYNDSIKCYTFVL